MARVRSWMFALTSFIGFASAFACSEDRDRFEEPPSFPPAGDASQPEVDACVGARRCSRDLTKVLDGCTDEVIETCRPDQGCGNGFCVDACASAELSKGSSGCSFWTLPPTAAPDHGRGACFAAIIANTWQTPVTISAELGAEPLDISQSVYTPHSSNSTTVYQRLEGPLPPGEVAIVFLSQRPPPAIPGDFVGCPTGTVPAVREDPIAHHSGTTRAFHLEVDAPVTAYSIFPYGGAISDVPTATLLLPVSAWSTSYVAITSAPQIGLNARRIVQLVANEDDTEVAMTPKVDVEDGLDIVGTARGVKKSWKLSRGQVLQFIQHDDLGGSAIETSKPIGLFGGAECTNIPANVTACDTLQQQIPPLAQWGHEYALVPYRPRIGSGTGTEVSTFEEVPYSLVGAAAGTILTYDPVRPLGAPEKLGPGEVVDFTSKELVVVKSQDADHPFHANVYMTGDTFYGRPGAPTTTGDPDFVNLVPSDQFLDHYVFFTDHTYADTTLTIVRRKDAQGVFLPVHLDCAGEIADFRPLGSSGEYEYAWVLMTKRFRPQKFGSSECGYGRHEARSDGPFSVMVWGTDSSASYGYAGGAGSRPLNQVKLPGVN